MGGGPLPAWNPGILDPDVAYSAVGDFSAACRLLLVLVVSELVIRTLEENVVFNDAPNTFYLRLYDVGDKAKDHSTSERRNRSPHNMGYSLHLAASVLLYAPSHIHDSTYYDLCYTSRGTLAGM